MVNDKTSWILHIEIYEEGTTLFAALSIMLTLWRLIDLLSSNLSAVFLSLSLKNENMSDI